jgi:hypothetical protein
MMLESGLPNGMLKCSIKLSDIVNEISYGFTIKNFVHSFCNRLTSICVMKYIGRWEMRYLGVIRMFPLMYKPSSQ